jgi:hypothetical protein
MPHCKDCNKDASFGYREDLKRIYCSIHKKDGMENLKSKKCKHNDGCSNLARSKSEFCKFHGGGDRCKYNGCIKSSQGNTNFCVEHGGGYRCKYDRCNTSARSNDDYCIKHGGGKRCNFDGCKYSAKGTTDFCITHGGGKRCKYDGCKTSAERGTDYCVKHGGGKRCKYDGCDKSAAGKTDFCKSHGGGNRCKYYEGCSKAARNKSNFCVEHGGGDRCPNCINWIDSRCGWSKYDGYCATCFKILFPDDERSKVIYRHTKEIMVRNEINKHFEGFVHDKPLYTHNCDCTHRRRIDHRKLIGNTILAIETDEFAHSGYDPLDEEIRYDDLYMIHSGKWVFIRFNPDGKGVDLFPEEKRSYEVAIEDKLDVLIREIDKQISRIENEENIELLEVVKLYY